MKDIAGRKEQCYTYDSFCPIFVRCALTHASPVNRMPFLDPAVEKLNNLIQPRSVVQKSDIKRRM